MPILRAFIGIDPGQSGGIAVIRGNTVSAIRMPETRKDLLEYLKDAIPPCTASYCTAVVEKVHAMPKQGVSSTFKFGMQYERTCFAVQAVGIRLIEATPQEWQKVFGLKKHKGESVRQWKTRLKAKAQELFPQLKVTLAIADALLIAEYCRKVIT